MNKFLSILILFILADVIADNSIVRVFGTQPPLSALILSTGILMLQMIAAPIQAGLSDFYCRKKSLIISLLFSLISLIILYITELETSNTLTLLIIILIMKGAFGNTIPLAWGALADTQESNLRFSLALSTGAYAIGYLILAILNTQTPKTIFSHFWLSPYIMPLILFALSIILCVLFFQDVRDRKLHLTNRKSRHEYLRIAYSEIISLLEDIRRRSTLFGLLAYLLWATSQYSVLVLLTDFQNKNTSAVIFMMIGYLLGVAILGFCKKIPDGKIIKTGFITTFFSFFLFFVGNLFIHENKITISISYFFYTMGNAFLSPSILSLFSKERAPHQQGKGFGLIVSADNGGFLLASIAVILFNILKLETNLMVVISFVLFAISWIPYSRYEKIRKDIDRK